MSTILIRNATVLTFTSETPVLKNHAVLIEGKKIKKIAPDAEFKDYKGKEIDAHGRIVMPGYINAHMHYYSTMVRGLGKAEPASDFIGVLENLWWRLDKKLTVEDSYYSALIPMIDAVKNGTTTLIDHHASPFHITGSLDAIAKAGKEVGLRNCLCYEVSDRDGQKIADEGMTENENFILRCEKENDDMLRGLYGLHASFTVSDADLERAADFVKKHNSGFHVHTAEAASDEEACEKEHGCRVVERFYDKGVLGKKTICPHCVHINEHEMDLLAETNTIVVTNPQSNLNNAVGIANLVKMADKGILIGLGTDAMTVNMREELRCGLWAQKYGRQDPACGFMELASTVAFNNPKICDRLWEGMGIGTLKEGGAADLIILDYLAPTPLNDATWLGHLIFGFANVPVDTTIVAGKILMENKELKLDIDVEQAYARSAELAEKLWDRF